ncbi:MAG: 3-deoxy-8-phosphooctulonate synthase, partial [Pseudomonadota bacterium]
MSLVSLDAQNWKIGTGAPLAVIAGLNVLENIDLAITVGRELKAVCERLGLPYIFKASFDKANR